MMTPYPSRNTPFMGDGAVDWLIKLAREIKILVEAETDDTVIGYMMVPGNRMEEWHFPEGWIFPVQGFRNDRAVPPRMYPFGLYNALAYADGPLCVDAILTTSYWGCVEGGTIVEPFYNRSGGTFNPVILYDMWAGCEWFTNNSHPESVSGMLLSAGYAIADYVIMGTDAAQRNRRTELAPYLSAMQLGMLEQKVSRGEGGLFIKGFGLDPRISEESEERLWQERLAEPHSPVRLFSGDRQNPIKRWQNTLDVYQKFLDTGGKATVKVTAPARMNLDKISEARSIVSRVHLYENSLPYNEWLALCRWGQMMVFSCKYDSFPANVTDAMIGGALVLLPRVRWTNRFMPNYPLLYETNDEALAAIRLFEEQGFAPFEETFRYVFRRFREFYSVAYEVREHILNLIDERIVQIGSRVGKNQERTLMKVYNAMKSEFTLDEFWELYLPLLGNPPGLAGVHGRQFLHKWLRLQGCLDVLSFKPKFRKTKRLLDREDYKGRGAQEDG